MPRSKSPQPEPGALSRYQNAELVMLPRAEIRNCPYNPRKISKTAAKRLRRELEKFKLQGALTVNERRPEQGWQLDECGHVLVSGHQRLRALDELEQRQDYAVAVTVMRLTPAQEREQVAFFNAEGAQGETAVEDLLAMLDFPGVDPDSAGWDKLELEVLDPDNRFGALYDEQEAPARARETAAELERVIDETAPARRKAPEVAATLDRERADRARKTAETRSAELYTVLVWESEEARDEFLARVGYSPGVRDISGQRVADLIS